MVRRYSASVTYGQSRPRSRAKLPFVAAELGFFQKPASGASPPSRRLSLPPHSLQAREHPQASHHAHPSARFWHRRDAEHRASRRGAVIGAREIGPQGTANRAGPIRAEPEKDKVRGAERG